MTDRPVLDSMTERRAAEEAAFRSNVIKGSEARFGMLKVSERRYAVIYRSSVSVRSKVVEGTPHRVGVADWRIVRDCERMTYGDATDKIIELRIAEDEGKQPVMETDF